MLLDGVSATIHPGEKVALVGRNGAGKSTLFALLGGALHEDGGELVSYEVLRLIWWALMGVLLIGYAVTDGFDLGFLLLM